MKKFYGAENSEMVKSGLLLPVISHMAADTSIMVVVIYYISR